MSRRPHSPPQPSTDTPAADPKTAALAAHGTLHPHPELVVDPLFAADPFFDPRDAVQVKYEMLRKVRVDGSSVTDAVRSFGLSRPTFYDAQAELEAGGLAALLPLKKGPRRAHKMTDEVVAWLAAALRDEPALTPADLAGRLGERRGVQVHARTVARALNRLGKA